jgi:S-phase kinase-associated protein 1
MPSKITLQSSDGKDFKEGIDVVKKSITIRTMLEDLGVESHKMEEEVKEVLPLPSIDAEVLEKILEWCRHHKDEPEPEKDIDSDSRYGDSKHKSIYVTKDFEKTYIESINTLNEEGEGIIFDIMIAANYLHIEGLLNSTCNELARMMRDAENGSDGGPGKHEGIRKKFNLPDDIGKGDDYLPPPGEEKMDVEAS